MNGLVLLLYFCVPLLMVVLMWVKYFRRLKAEKRELALFPSGSQGVTGTILSVGRSGKTGIDSPRPYTRYWDVRVRYEYGGTARTSSVRVYQDRDHHAFKTPKAGDSLDLLVDTENPEIAVADQAVYIPGGQYALDSIATPVILAAVTIFILWEIFHPFLSLTR